MANHKVPEGYQIRGRNGDKANGNGNGNKSVSVAQQPAQPPLVDGYKPQPKYEPLSLPGLEALSKRLDARGLPKPPAPEPQPDSPGLIKIREGIDKLHADFDAMQAKWNAEKQSALQQAQRE